MYTGPDGNPYMSNIPLWPVFVKELRKMGFRDEALRIAQALQSIGWRD
jgi:hypothetical protein